MTSKDELRLQIENVDLRRLLEQAGVDAAERRTTASLQRLILEELHHRVKNSLATVLAIVSQSLRSATSLEAGREAVTGRLVALGRVQDILLRAEWKNAPLEAVVQDAIEPFNAGGKRFVVNIVDIEVGAAAVLPLAMVLNELCTNAVKYGALSNESGQVTIEAVPKPQQDRFRLCWTERGGPPVKEPTHRSFGSKLIEHSFVRQLHGEARLSFVPEGLVCVFDIPLTALKAPPLAPSDASRVQENSP